MLHIANGSTVCQFSRFLDQTEENIANSGRMHRNNTEILALRCQDKQMVLPV